MTGPDVTVGCEFKGGRKTIDVPSPAIGQSQAGRPKVFDGHDARSRVETLLCVPGPRVEVSLFIAPA